MRKFCIVIVLSLNFFPTIMAQGGALPFGRTTLFAGSGLCEVCHSSDGIVLTVNGIDVSPPTYWRSTMMANASKDPFWLAMVSEEVHKYPQHQQMIETTCTKCHSPMGYKEAVFNGQTTYSISQMKADPIANDGVSCSVCHQIKKDNFGMVTSYSGNYQIDPDSIIYGPYPDPEPNAMIEMAWYTPVYTNHLNQSELCATCHTLFTPYLDNQGQIAGTFPEQTPYLEWKNSVYLSLDFQCQSCHMPMITDSIDIASIPQFHQELRSPYWKHNFVGGNVYMLNLLKNNISELGLTASEDNFDSTIARAEKNLIENAAVLELSSQFKDDSLEVSVTVKNKTGHKLPTGIPFRRMWIHLKILDSQQNIVFESGNWNAYGEIEGLNNNYEPHYDVVRNEDEIQIYEGVFADVDDQVTYTLLRASKYVKDNRIPPIGFTTQHLSYDTTAIVGEALLDSNFNRIDGVEGTGNDVVKYRIPVFVNSNYYVTAQLCYQTIKPRIAEYLSGISEPDINQFVGMYNQLANTPFIMQTKEENIFINSNNQVVPASDFILYQNYPNPFSAKDGSMYSGNPNTNIQYAIRSRQFVTLKVYDVLGKEVITLVDEEKPAGSYSINFNASGLTSGVYFYRLTAGSFTSTKKMLLLR